MKIAYCIACHKYTSVLEALIKWLGENNDFYIHVDAKVDLSLFDPLKNRKNIFICRNRIKVYWGTYSQIKCTLLLFRMTQLRNYDYVVFISGDTLPLRNASEIENYLEKNKGNEFVIMRTFEQGYRERLKYRYPVKGMRCDSFMEKMVTKVRSKYHLFRRNPYYKFLPTLAFGSNWMIITPEFRDYIFDYLDDNPFYSEAFRRSCCGDELFFHTIIVNSPFKCKISKRAFLYVDWETGPQYPKLLDNSDFSRIQEALEKEEENHYYLFARKFSDDINLARFYQEYLQS